MHKNTYHLNILRTFTLITFLSVGCGGDDGASSPVAPSAMTTTAGNTSATTTTGLSLKTVAATPESPINNAVVASQSPMLVAVSASNPHQQGITYDHEFELVRISGGVNTAIETATVTSSGGKTSYRVTEQLASSSTYQWLVRPLFDGVYGDWSAYASFSTSTLNTVGIPIPTSPINGITVSSLLPVFNVTNGTNEGAVGEVIYQIQISTDNLFSTIVQEVGTHARSRGDTNIALQTALTASTEYFWRVRGRNDGQGKTALRPGLLSAGEVVSSWSATFNFFTPATGGSGTYSCCPPPNRLSVALSVGAEIGYPGSVDVRDFTQKVAERLNAEDANWGRRINTSGPLGKDTVAYKASDGRPYSIDIVSGAMGSNPKIHWDAHGFIGGTWVAP